MKLLHVGLDAAKSPDTSLMKFFKRRVREYRDINTSHPAINQAIIGIVGEFKPDVVFMQIQAAGIVNNEALRFMKECGAYVINFTGDVRDPLPKWYIHTGKLVDLSLFTNMPDVYEARINGVSADFCVMGYDPDIYRPDYNIQKSIDVAFFANHYEGVFPLSEYRKQTAGFLKRAYGDRFKLYGNGWKIADGSFMDSQHHEARQLNRVKIAINISHYEYERYSSDRLNRTLGCGVMCLTHIFPGMEQLGLIDGETCATFKDHTELQSKIAYYLKHEDERKKIAAAGYKLATETLTFNSMIERALSFYTPSYDKYIEFAAREIRKESV